MSLVVEADEVFIGFERAEEGTNSVVPCGCTREHVERFLEAEGASIGTQSPNDVLNEHKGSHWLRAEETLVLRDHGLSRDQVRVVDLPEGVLLDLHIIAGCCIRDGIGLEPAVGLSVGPQFAVALIFYFDPILPFLAGERKVGLACLLIPHCSTIKLLNYLTTIVHPDHQLPAFPSLPSLFPSLDY